MNLLITGGLGYIGAHLTVELLKKKRVKIFILDDLSNSKISKKKLLKNYQEKKLHLLKMI